MTSGYQHKVLVVVDDAQIGKAICRLLDVEELKSVSVNKGESALEIFKKADPPFSLIIAAQRIPGIQVTRFLEHARELHPETLRFLITGHSEMETLINAVNKGAVQRYMSMPWDTDEMVRAIRSGIGRYERFLENKALLTLAKKQNAKLYELNCQLMETAKTHGKELLAIDTEIESIETQLKNLTSHTPLTPHGIMKEVQAIIAPMGKKGQAMLNELFAQTIVALHREFNDLSLKNGFEMSPPGKRKAP